MKKFFLLFATSVLAIGAMAQQWSGSSTTSGTISRNGIVQMLPDSSGVPYTELTPNHFKVFRYYGNQYPWENVEVAWDGIHLRRTVPAPSSSADIGHGTFYFSNYYNTGNKYIRFDSNGLLSSNGIISTTDSVLAANVKVTSTIKGNTGIFSNISSTEISVNGAQTSSTYGLSVNSGIRCEELLVTSDVPSSDYVFEPEYSLMSLSDVEKFIMENKHLPEISSAKEFKENGYKVGEMDDILLRKIEELTLYIIDLQKQIEKLKQEK